MNIQTEQKIERYIDQVERERRRVGLEKMAADLRATCDRLTFSVELPGATYKPGAKK